MPHHHKELKEKLLKDIEKLKSKKGYLNAGYPNYNTLFGRDSLISAWQMLPIDADIAKNTLEILAKYQAEDFNDKKESEPGKILHEYRFDKARQEEIPNWGWPYYGSVDSTSLFIIVAAKYYTHSGDKDFIKKIWKNLEAAVSWHLENAQINKHSFITYNPRNPHSLVHQGWRDAFEDHLKISPPPVAIAEEQGYAYKAYKDFYTLATELSKENEVLPKKVAAAAEKLKDEFNEVFWLKDKRYFALGLNKHNKPRKAVASNPGHLLFCDDFIDPDKKEAVVNRLFQKDMFTAGGIRTHSADEPDFDACSYHLGSVWPHDNWIIYYGLIKIGADKKAGQVKAAMLRAHDKLKHIPELFGVKDNKIFPLEHIDQLSNNCDKQGDHLPSFKANALQAWASAGLLNMVWRD